jgi:hypothetical protein
MDGRQRDFFKLTLGTTALVAAFGIINDQVVAALVPQHFEVYYPQYLPLKQAWAQALVYPLLGDVWPGAVWGMLLYWVGIAGKSPAVRMRTILPGVGVAMLLAVATAWGVGLWSKSTGTPFFPAYFYPSDDKGLFFSQTVELTYAIAGSIYAVIWLAGVIIVRLWNTPKLAEGT